MKLAALQKKLLAAAKANPPADRVPLAFEKRILANLKAPQWLIFRRFGRERFGGPSSVRCRHRCSRRPCIRARQQP